jgi:predicted DNA-binding transcriptional regulator YafY
MPAKSYERHHGMIKTLNRAILEHRMVEVVYHGIGKSSRTRKIQPFAIVLFQSSLYIIGAACEIADPEHRMRTWKLERFEKVTILDERFKPPDDLELDRFVGNSLGVFLGNKPRDFTIRIAPHAARWVVEDPWHPNQKVKELPDGSIELSVKAVHDLEIIPRVLNLGADAEVISPASAREQMAGIVKRMAKIYAK